MTGLDTVIAVERAGMKTEVLFDSFNVGLKQFLESHPNGKYLMFSRSHCMALVDGIKTDTMDFPVTNRVVIKFAVEVK